MKMFKVYPGGELGSHIVTNVIDVEKMEAHGYVYSPQEAINNRLEQLVEELTSLTNQCLLKNHEILKLQDMMKKENMNG